MSNAASAARARREPTPARGEVATTALHPRAKALSLDDFLATMATGRSAPA
jgi:hypothetical protein